MGGDLYGNWNGGALSVASLDNSGTASINGTAASSGGVNNSGALSVASGGTLSAGSLSNSGSLNVSGALHAGSLNNSGNAYIIGSADIRGSTDNSGTLIVNGGVTSASLSNSGAIGGAGTIHANLINRGIISPGNSIDTLKVAGTVTFEPGSTLQAEIASDFTSDLLAVSGPVTINGGAISTSLPKALYANGASWKIISAEGWMNGIFDTIKGQPDSEVVNGAEFIGDAAVAEFGLGAALNSGLEFFADYRVTWADDYLAQALSAGLMYCF